MKKISILIVEDEEKLLARLVKYISIFCDTVYEAVNGYEALKIYNKHLPDIVLTDINMPKLRGIEFIEKIRQIDKNSQIIILSAHTHTDDFLKIVPLNLVSYLVKPVQMEQLKSAILQAINNISQNNFINLSYNYSWNEETKTLYLNDKKVELTSYENIFLEALILKLNQYVSYEDIHNHIYDFDEYSQNAIFTIVKRVRKKTIKDLILCCSKFGYKIESNSLV